MARPLRAFAKSVTTFDLQSERMFRKHCGVGERAFRGVICRSKGRYTAGFTVLTYPHRPSLELFSQGPILPSIPNTHNKMDHDKDFEESKLSASHTYDTDQERDLAVHNAPLAEILKGRWDRSWPVIACGAGLFSDGYLNGVIGSVSTMLQLIYGKEYTSSSYKSAVPSIAFAGTVIGHLFFGVLR